MAGFTSCVPRETETPITRPQGATDLNVVATTEVSQVFEGVSVTLFVTASGGTPPYSFRWDQNGGPEELTLVDVTEASLSVPPLTAPGRYVFRVVGVDVRGFSKMDFVAVVVLPALNATVPALAVVGEPVTLSATVEAGVEDISLLWEVVRGSATLDDPAASEPTLTTSAGETVEVLLSISLPSAEDEPTVSTRSFEIVSVVDLQPRVLIETNMGTITLELEGEAAPLHTANFLLHVDEGFFDGLLFHRNACSENAQTGECEPFVLQGGGFARVDGEVEAVDLTRDPVPSEADNGLTNGTVHSVALALSGGDPDSGTTQFFINLADNSFLDDLSFTVFAMVVDGIDVVEAIVAGERTDSPILTGEVSLPVEDVIMERVTRIVD